MTCVWDSLIKGIPIDQLNEVIGNKKKLDPSKKKKYDHKEKSLKKDLKRDIFVKYLQKNIRKTSKVSVNGEQLTEQQINENFKAIQSLSANNICDGYYCSTCDPFLILVCELFECSIFHTYMNSHIKYECTDSKFIMYLRSSSTHMSHNRTTIINNSDHFEYMSNKFELSADN